MFTLCHITILYLLYIILYFILELLSLALSTFLYLKLIQRQKIYVTFWNENLGVLVIDIFVSNLNNR